MAVALFFSVKFLFAGQTVLALQPNKSPYISDETNREYLEVQMMPFLSTQANMLFIIIS
jgi:hypothetical protein